MQAREGTGLGLPISRQFVQLMGGNLEVSSQLGKGSIFYFTIPVQLNPNNQVIIPSQRRIISLVPGQETVKILIVDDQAENCDLITQLLTVVGFQTLAVVNGQEAIAAWQNWQPNLILMDMRMPVMDGYQATQEIRRLETATYPHQHTIIIAVTASAFDEQQSQTLAAGCDDFTGKPFQESEIFQKIALYLGVKYIYAEDNSSTISPTNPDSLQAEDLMVMPSQWRQQMHEAATRVNAKLIEQLLTQIPPQYANLSQNLQELIQQFRFDIILELTQK
jgi:two-component system, sensor histidine kinase and response regulator